MTSTIFVDADTLSSKKGHKLCFALQQEHEQNGTKIVLMTDDGKINALSYVAKVKSDGYSFLSGVIHHNLFNCSTGSVHFWSNVETMFDTKDAQVITNKESAARKSKENGLDTFLISRKNTIEEAVQTLRVFQPVCA